MTVLLARVVPSAADISNLTPPPHETASTKADELSKIDN
jgi:hypothetical protein